MNVFPYGPLLFEGHKLALRWSNSTFKARRILSALLDSNQDLATELSTSAACTSDPAIR